MSPVAVIAVHHKRTSHLLVPHKVLKRLSSTVMKPTTLTLQVRKAILVATVREDVTRLYRHHQYVAASCDRELVRLLLNSANPLREIFASSLRHTQSYDGEASLQ